MLHHSALVYVSISTSMFIRLSCVSQSIVATLNQIFYLKDIICFLPSKGFVSLVSRPTILLWIRHTLSVTPGSVQFQISTQDLNLHFKLTDLLYNIRCQNPKPNCSFCFLCAYPSVLNYTVSIPWIKNHNNQPICFGIQF